MKPFYSIREIADILNKDVYAVCNGLIASRVPAYFNGKCIDLSKYDCFRPIGSGERVFINLSGPPKPSPSTVIVSTEDLPESWMQSICPKAESSHQEHHLLESESADPHTVAGQPNHATQGVDRNRILAAFPPPKGVTPAQWSKRLGDPSKKMKAARVFSGSKGGVSALWNPARFAMWYSEENHSTKQNLTIIIRREFPEYLQEWESYINSFN